MSISAPQERLRNLLNNVFDNFDFEKVKKTMDALDWKWCNIKRQDPKNPFKEKVIYAVPTLEEIMNYAANLMWECACADVDTISSCGFRVEKDFNDPEDLWMRLAFEVSEIDFSSIALETIDNRF